jgi:hypothetical protein
MTRSVTLWEARDSTGALTTVEISTGWGSTIVVNEGTYYPRIGDEGSRERDESIVVRAENLPLLASRLDVDGTQRCAAGGKPVSTG